MLKHKKFAFIPVGIVNILSKYPLRKFINTNYLIILILLCTNVLLGFDNPGKYNSNKIQSERDINNIYSEEYPRIGFRVGYHSRDMDDGISEFGGGATIDVYLLYLLNKCELKLGMAYWNAYQTEQESSGLKNVRGKALIIGFNTLPLITNRKTEVSLGVSAKIGALDQASNTVFAYEPGIQLKIPIFSNKGYLVSTIAYEHGIELMRLAGGGMNYSFTKISFGLESSNIKNLLSILPTN